MQGPVATNCYSGSILSLTNALYGYRAGSSFIFNDTQVALLSTVNPGRAYPLLLHSWSMTSFGDAQVLVPPVDEADVGQPLLLLTTNWNRVRNLTSTFPRDTNANWSYAVTSLGTLHLQALIPIDCTYGASDWTACNISNWYYLTGSAWPNRSYLSIGVKFGPPRLMGSGAGYFASFVYLNFTCLKVQPSNDPRFSIDQRDRGVWWQVWVQMNSVNSPSINAFYIPDSAPRPPSSSTATSVSSHPFSSSVAGLYSSSSASTGRTSVSVPSSSPTPSPSSSTGPALMSSTGSFTPEDGGGVGLSSAMLGALVAAVLVGVALLVLSILCMLMCCCGVHIACIAGCLASRRRGGVKAKGHREPLTDSLLSSDSRS